LVSKEQIAKIQENKLTVLELVKLHLDQLKSSFSSIPETIKNFEA